MDESIKLRPVTGSQVLPISVLTIEPNEIKILDKEHEIKLHTSLERFGQLRNILVDANWNVIEGRNIARIMRELGYKYIEVKMYMGGDVLPQLVLGSEYSHFDFVRTSMALAKHFDLTNKGVLYDKLPFKNDDIEDYVESTAFSIAQFNAHRQPQQATLFGGEPEPDELTDGLFAPERMPEPELQMRALSWKEPFATLMLQGKIETRKWDTDYRGPVLLCASKSPYSEKDVLAISGQHQLSRILAAVGDSFKTPLLGHAYAIADLAQVRPMSVDDADACFVQYNKELFCHVYENIRRITPIEFKGAQGWTKLTPDFVDTLELIDDAE